MSPAAREVYRAGPPRWELAPAIDEAAAVALASALNLPVAMGRILVARGTVDPDQAKRLLRPLLEHLKAPSVLVDLDRAVDRIRFAINRGEIIFVHGDYDVDGVCAAALLTRWIRRLGGSVVPFVPHRLRDGYDLSLAGIERAVAAGAGLLVTVDCGIVAHDAVADAIAAGLDVIVTDHHTPGAELPAAHAVVNPNRSDDSSDSGILCGAAVAFKLCQGLAERAGIGFDELVADLDLVALATVADLVPLMDENRVLTRYGLRAIAQTTKVGLRALLDVCGLQGQTPDAGQLGFQLAPRINAVGRMGDANDALELLLTDDPAEARRLARHLDGLNTQRKEEDQRTLDAAFDQLATDFDPETDFGVVLAGEGWHPGVIGIVASRVVERIHRPVVMIAVDGAKARGSARSIPGFDLYQAIAANREHLGRFGGHKQAAGMDLSPASIPAFRDGFNQACRAELEGQELIPRFRGDLDLGPADATLELADLAEYLGPHGMGNPRPVFIARGVTVTSAREVGKGHLKVELTDGAARCEGIGFGLVEHLAPAGLVGVRVDVLYRLNVNEYRGRRSPQMVLLDLRPVGSGS